VPANRRAGVLHGLLTAAVGPHQFNKINVQV
jgi:hypothetical protein